MSPKHDDFQRIKPDVDFGLTDENVNYLISKGKINKTKNPTNKSYFQIVIHNIFTPFNILMFSVAIILTLIVGPKVVTNLMFLLIIFFNILIGTIQECKSKHTIEKLKLLSDSRITVRRNGKEEHVLSQDILLDEIIILSPGDQIPADCIVEDDVVLEVNEALLTGESVPVKKGRGQPLFAGSFVVSGLGAVRADKVGNDTYISSIENKAKLAKQPKSRLMLAISKIIRVMACIAIPLSLFVFVNELLQNVALKSGTMPMFPTYWGEESLVSDAVFYGGTTITYMIPAGMALLASIAMATGIVKLAGSSVLVQNLYSVESLSRVNTLCLDKTGTLTDGTMTVESYKIISSQSDEEIQNLMGSYLSAFKATNQTSTALINKFGNKGNFKVIDRIEFSSARKYSCVKFDNKRWYALGAPEYLTNDKKILQEVDEFAKKGLRVVLLVAILDEVKEDKPLPGYRQNIAMFIIRDTIRPEVYDTMRWFRENDVDIKVISGDNIGTVSYIAKQSGIDNWDKVVDMSLVKEDDDLEEIVMNNSIFGRVNPDQKADIIRILKKNGRITGVTGDGLNDLLAFKQADCAIALANGAAATKNVANLILLDSNFANMKEAVFQGRRVVNNIQRSSSLFVMKDFLWMFITILPILLGIQHVLQPTVMTIVNIFITGIASLFISLEPDRTRVTGNFYKNVVKRGVLAGFYMFIPVVLIMAYVITSQLIQTQNFNLDAMKTVFVDGEVTKLGWVPIVSLCITISGFVIFYENCKPFTKFRKILFAATLAIVVIVLYLTPDYFIISGTDMLKETGGFVNILSYTFKHIGDNALFALYRTMNLEQLLFLVFYFLVAVPLYIFNKKYTSRVIEKLLFSKREYLDE